KTARARNRSGATVVSASGFMRAYRAHAARPITEKTDRVPEARIDLGSALVTLDGRPWHRIGAPVPWPEVQADAVLLAPYFEGFGRFYGDAPGLQRSYWALVCSLYAAPSPPPLRGCAPRRFGATAHRSPTRCTQSSMAAPMAARRCSRGSSAARCSASSRGSPAMT